MSDILHIAVQPSEAGACEVTVAGELDVYTAPRLRDALRHAVATHQRTTVDLSGLQFCDCSGLSALLEGNRLAKAHDTELRLRAVPRCLDRIARITHTSRALTIERSGTTRTR